MIFFFFKFLASDIGIANTFPLSSSSSQLLWLYMKHHAKKGSWERLSKERVSEGRPGTQWSSGRPTDLEGWPWEDSMAPQANYLFAHCFSSSFFIYLSACSLIGYSTMSGPKKRIKKKSYQLILSIQTKNFNRSLKDIINYVL